MTYMIHNGKHHTTVSNLKLAYNVAIDWSKQCSDVITIINGSRTYCHHYRGKEISSLEAEKLWKSELYREVVNR